MRRGKGGGQGKWQRQEGRRKGSAEKEREEEGNLAPTVISKSRCL